MISVTELTAYMDGLLAIHTYRDYAPNGLQIEGRREVARLATAVTASLDALDQAADWGADALLVHHGYFWQGEDACILGAKKRRIARCLTAGINLLAYHLPLDGHAELGNNVRLAMKLGIVPRGPLPTEPLLWTGVLPQTLDAATLARHLTARLHREPLYLAGGPLQIHTVAWCSGGGQKLLTTAAQAGVDAFISGEASESSYHLAYEYGIHYFACGHHATERYGVQALGEHVAQRFDLEYCYLESDNPV